jgi:hypothetical protein
MRCGLHRINQGLPALLACQPPEVVCCDDDDFFAAMNGHVLRTFLFRPPHYLAEPGFGVLQLPLPRSRAA